MIAGFVVKSRFRFVRNYYLNRKIVLSKSATTQSVGTLCDTFELHETQRNRIKKNKQKLNYVNYEKYNYKN